MEINAWLGRVSAVLLVGLASFGVCRAETDLFAYVTNEWYQCRKDNVLRVAVERLADNPRDVVGLLLMLEYDMAYARNEAYTNSIERCRRVAEDVNSPVFGECKEFHFMDLDSLLLFATNSLDSELSQSDIDKENSQHVSMHFLEEFKALDDDGLTATNTLRRAAPALIFR